MDERRNRPWPMNSSGRRRSGAWEKRIPAASVRREPDSGLWRLPMAAHADPQPPGRRSEARQAGRADGPQGRNTTSSAKLKIARRSTSRRSSRAGAGDLRAAPQIAQMAADAYKNGDTDGDGFVGSNDPQAVGRGVLPVARRAQLAVPRHRPAAPRGGEALRGGARRRNWRQKQLDREVAKQKTAEEAGGGHRPARARSGSGAVRALRSTHGARPPRPLAAYQYGAEGPNA